MSSQPELTGNGLRYSEWVLVTLVLVISFVVVLTPAAASVAWYMRRKQMINQGSLLVLGLSVLWSLVVVSGFSIEDFFTVRHWAYALPAAPAASVLLQGLYLVVQFLKPKTLQEQLEAQTARAERDRLRQSHRAGNPGQAPEVLEWLTLGAVQTGDAYPDYLGLAYRDGFLLVHESTLDQHMFLLGSTGAGKSETIKRLVQEILTKTQRHIYFVDGKGDESLASDIRSLAYLHGRGQAPVFRLGFDHYGAVYDGFRGQATDVYNRLCALVGVQEAEGNAQYYADINRDLLQLICFADIGPPRSFEEIRGRLNKAWLLNAYVDNALEQQTIQEEITDKDIKSLSRRIRPLMREFASCVGPEGFALEDVPCAIFSMRVQSVGDTSRRFLDFLVEDLKDFVGKRQRHPAVLIIDEFGQFANDNIISLLTLARSSRLGVVLATQHTSTLKDEQIKQNVLANTRTKLLMATDFPEEVAKLAGTVYHIESSVQHEDGETTGVGSARVQHTFKIDMNEVAKLQSGEAFVIRQRYATKIKVHPIGQVEPVGEQREELRESSRASNSWHSRKQPISLEPS